MASDYCAGASFSTGAGLALSAHSFVRVIAARLIRASQQSETQAESRPQRGGRRSEAVEEDGGDVSLFPELSFCAPYQERFERRSAKFRASANALEENGIHRGEGECVINSRLNSRPVNVAESHAQIIPWSEMEVIADCQ